MQRVEVIIFSEGQTEEQFVKRVIAPEFTSRNIFIKAQTLHTSKDAKGGDVSFQRFKDNAEKIITSNKNIVLTTLFDLYGLKTDFPGFNNAKSIKCPIQRCISLEERLHKEIISALACRPERFIPYIQPHEFEGLLFSDVEALVSVNPGWDKFKPELAKIRGDFETPEHINNSFETKPSKRLEILNPNYQKVLHGSAAAQLITLNKIEQECVHFKSWMDKLRKLADFNIS